MPRSIEGAVCAYIKQVVLVAAEPQSESLLLPKRLEESLALLRCVVVCVLLVQIVMEASEATLTHGMDLGIERLQLILLFRTQVTPAHRECKVRCTLIDREVRRLGTHLLDALDSTSTGTNDCDSLVCEVDALLRPEGRMVDLALEAVKAWYIRNIFKGLSAIFSSENNHEPHSHRLAANPAATTK